ncbi:hypothetical protein HG536_0C01710 [Torulaspora globosa]|uniref:AB hydrolase-1 domain-containing protein n=1 Tax=Torulaspora globosa TaxID=48254 RepID=A0A7G3ZER7_9SACH|nr:uncharacterized protein HG536_0C01710 [Torulaspora globosa]QLL32003.1 hypothetical protein HG536_0C01710 [Torulaspora globosa]
MVISVRPGFYIRGFSSARTAVKDYSLQAKIVKRLLNPPVNLSEEEQRARPTIRMWLSRWNDTKETERELKEFQDKIMQDVQVAGTKENELSADGINQWHFHNSTASKITTPTLLVHGYAASSMAYYRTFSGLSENIRDLYAIDLPANGLSKDLPFKAPKQEPQPLKVKYIDEDKFSIPCEIDVQRNKEIIEHCENYYLDKIEDWRKMNRLEKINLVGHSYGGYLSFKYALKYPSSVEKLCLVSPAGVESSIFSINNKFNAKETYTLDMEDPSSKFYLRKRQVPAFIFKNQSDILRWMGPLGAKLTWSYITSAYKRLPTVEYKEYLFELIYGRGGIPLTARQIFTTLFTRHLLARDPIMDSLDKLQAKNVLLLYGHHDWMNKFAGYKMVERLNSSRRDTSADYMEVPEAGHNLMLDNPQFFNNSLIEFLSTK